MTQQQPPTPDARARLRARLQDRLLAYGDVADALYDLRLVEISLSVADIHLLIQLLPLELPLVGATTGCGCAFCVRQRQEAQRG